MSDADTCEEEGCGKPGTRYVIRSVAGVYPVLCQDHFWEREPDGDMDLACPECLGRGDCDDLGDPAPCPRCEGTGRRYL